MISGSTSFTLTNSARTPTWSWSYAQRSGSFGFFTVIAVGSAPCWRSKATADLFPHQAKSCSKVDELTALNQILQDTATEIIDIASIEHTQGVEQADYNEKAAHYAKRLAQVGAQLVAKHADPAPLMVEAPS